MWRWIEQSCCRIICHQSLVSPYQKWPRPPAFVVFILLLPVWTEFNPTSILKIPFSSVLIVFVLPVCSSPPSCPLHFDTWFHLVNLSTLVVLECRWFRNWEFSLFVLFGPMSGFDPWLLYISATTDVLRVPLIDFNGTFSQQICHTSTIYIYKKDFFFLAACSFVAETDSFIIRRRAHSAIKQKKKQKKELIRCSVTVVNIKHSFPLGHSLRFIIHLRACCMEMNKFCLTMTWNVNTCIPTASVYPFKGEF